MVATLLKRVNVDKLFGETDVWHQRRFPLGRRGMVKGQNSGFFLTI